MVPGVHVRIRLAEVREGAIELVAVPEVGGSWRNLPSLSSYFLTPSRVKINIFIFDNTCLLY
jgi:hypothetical protein